MFCCTREASLFLLNTTFFFKFKYVHIVTMILVAGRDERKQRRNSHAPYVTTPSRGLIFMYNTYTNMVTH
jgi:hypothetical protein